MADPTRAIVRAVAMHHDLALTRSRQTYVMINMTTNSKAPAGMLNYERKPVSLITVYHIWDEYPLIERTKVVWRTPKLKFSITRPPNYKIVRSG